MVPFLDLEKTSKDNHTKQNKVNTNNEEKEDFSDFLSNFLHSDDKEKKVEIKGEEKETQENLASTHKEKAKQKANKSSTEVLKGLNEKYNILPKDSNFKDAKFLDIKEKILLKDSQNIEKKSHIKTLKDVVEKADKLNLNLKKISISNKESLNKQDLPLDTLIVIKPKQKQEKIPQSSLLENILQDKNLHKKKDSKHFVEVDSKNKEILKKSNTTLMTNVKLDTQKKDEKVTESKNTHPKTSLESKKDDFKKVDSKIINQKEVENPQKNTNILQKEPQKESEQKLEKNITKKENSIKEAKPQKEINTDNNKIHKEKIIDSKEVLETKENKTKESLKIEIKVEAKEANISNEIHKEKVIDFKEKLEIKSNLESLKENKAKESPKEKRINQESILKEKAAFKKESVSLKVEKSHKEDKKSLSEILRDSKNNVENLAMNLQKEVQRETQKEQLSFIDNLFNTESIKHNAIKHKQEELSQEKESNKEKTKTKEEIFATNIQNQNQVRFEPQTTFSHFSDKLREAIQNYKPPITKLTLELNPDNLGSVELTLTKRGDKIHIQVGSNSQALQLFMQNMQEFKNQLNNLGFNDVSLDFKDTSGNSLLGNGFGDSSQNQNNNPQQQHNQERALQSYQQNETESTQSNIAEMEISFYYEA